jgi:tetratricopeptide (TPR) repeat protein
MDLIWNFSNDNAAVIGALAVLVALFFGIRKHVFGWFGLSPRPPSTEVTVNLTDTPEEPTIKLTLEQFEKRIAAKIKTAKKAQKSANAKKQKQLRQTIEERESQLRDLETAFAKEKERIASLEDALKREGNTLDPERSTAAREALENGNYDLAKQIFTEILNTAEDAANLQSQRAARAAYALGNIAAAEIRWADAATLYAKSATLDPTHKHLFAAREFHWRTGEHKVALALGDPMITAAINEFGDGSNKHAVALNEHALTLKAMGDYQSAEPMYKQAIAIDKVTIGEGHQDHAIRLNNLAALYYSAGDYLSAEPLFKQAIAIDKATIGEEHPEYAIHLNNLAELYRAMGDYPSAEPLYKQAMEIGKATIGEDHPDYAIRLNNLAGLYDAMGDYPSAEPLFKQAIAISQNSLMPDHPNTKTFKANLAKMQAARDKG